GGVSEMIMSSDSLTIIEDRRQLLTVRRGPIDRQLRDDFVHCRNDSARLLHPAQCNVIAIFCVGGRSVRRDLHLVAFIQHLQDRKRHANFGSGQSTAWWRCWE